MAILTRWHLLEGRVKLSNWAELKDVFEPFDVEMPIVMPRLRITYLNDRIEKITFEIQYSIRKVLVDGVEGERSKVY